MRHSVISLIFACAFLTTAPDKSGAYTWRESGAYTWAASGSYTSREAAAQVGHDHDHGSAALGVVRFPTTCRADAQPAFDRGLALLHSFGYEEARRAFTEAAERDPACGIAHWGVALSYYHPIWASPTEAEFVAGRTAAETAARIGAKSDRERRYITAAGTFFAPGETRDYRARAVAYKDTMTLLAADLADDAEAQILLALSLLGTAPAADTTYAQQKQAAGMLNRLLQTHPNHPGLQHYTIHAFDYPALASLALPAARAYAKLAPASPHALHMPSHIFTRLGLWDECIAANLNAAATAAKAVSKSHPGATSFDALHAMDYLAYAYLQRGQDQDAARIVTDVAKVERFDEPNFAAAYAVVAVPARYALERHDWAAAAALTMPSVSLPWQQYPYGRAVTLFANAVGAARTGDLARARSADAALQTLERELAARPPSGPYDWAGQVAALRLASAAWIAHAEGRAPEAVQLLSEAADKEDAVGKHPVMPGALLPAREQLGDLQLALGRPADALAAYTRALADTPGRFNSLAGATRAARDAGRTEDARTHAAALATLCGPGCTRPEAKGRDASPRR